MHALVSSLVKFLFLAQFLASSSAYQVRRGIFDSVSLCPADSKQDWSYRGRNGPMYWGEKYPDCYKNEQSPIDIDTSQVVSDESLEKLQLENYDKPLTKAKVENNGHSIEVVPDDGVVRSLTIDGSTYTLRQFHFHWGKSFDKGSEHTIDGQGYALEVHFVHLNDQNKIAVVGVIFQEDKSNDELQNLVKLFPKLKYKGDETEMEASMTLENFFGENPFSYIRYMGSLTTPGCHEDVTWSVSTIIRNVGKDQMIEFRKLYSTGKDGADDECTIAENFRPVQPLNGRAVSISN